MRYFTLFNIFIIFFTSNIKAQTETVFVEKKDNYVLFNSSSTTNTNAFQLIKKLAEGNAKSIQKTEYLIQFKQNLRIEKELNTYSLIIDINNLNTKGDTYYKGFPMHKELIPNSATLKVDVVDNRNSVIKKYNFKDVTIQNNNLDLLTEHFTDTVKREYKLIVYDLYFNYSNRAINNFNNVIAVINTYYESDFLLAKTAQILSTVNPNDIDNLSFQQANLAHCENIMSDINFKKISENLPLNEFDPIHFNKKINTLQAQISAKQSAINFTLATLHEVFYNRGLESLANNQILAAQKWFTKSLDVNPTFSPSILQLAKIDFANGNLNDAETRVKDIFIKTNPDPQTKQYSGELAAKISTQYTALAEEQNKKNNFQQALNNLQKAKSLCLTIPGLVCNEKMQLNISLAKNGIYNTIVKEATKLFNEGNLKQAENKVNEAYTYQKQNNEEIFSTAEADTLLSKIKQNEYNQTIFDAKNNLKSKDYNKALQLFNNAEELKINYNLLHDVNFVKLRAEAAKPILIIKIEEALNLVNTKQLENAKLKGKQIENQQSIYNLINDKDLNTLLDKLQAAIFAQECANAQKEIDKLYTQAKKAINNKDFVEANSLFLDAIELIDTYPMCSFTNTTLKDEQINNLPAATYQKLLNKTLDLQNTYRYKEAIENYNIADKYFYQLEVEKLGLTNTSLYDFSLKKGNTEWQKYIAQYFLENKEYEQSLLMCKTLIEKGIKPNKIKYTLYDLGKIYGAKDKAEKTIKKPKTEVLFYTQGNKKLNYFKKGYLKNF